MGGGALLFLGFLLTAHDIIILYFIYYRIIA